MYYSTQTLVHKETKQLARLDLIEDGQWAYNIGKETPFINEQGEKFVDDISKYQPVYNEWDEVCAEKDMPKGVHLQTHFKKYVNMSDAAKTKLKNKYLRQFKKDAKNQVEKALDFITKGVFDEDCDFESKLIHMSFSKFCRNISLRGVYDENVFIPRDLMHKIKMYEILIGCLEKMRCSYTLNSAQQVIFMFSGKTLKSPDYQIITNYIDSRFDINIYNIIRNKEFA